MHTILKYELLENADGDYKLIMPKNAQILHIDYQSKKPCLWALVDDEQPTECIFLKIFGTGWKIDDLLNLTYLKTIQNGIYVWHIFKVIS